MKNNEYYFKNNFTKEGEKVNLEINKLTAECITSKNNKFSLDSEGNLSVNSITTNGLNSQTEGNPFPIGSIYMNVNPTNPSELFGGTWEQIQDRFLLACGNTFLNGTMGGETAHKLTKEEIPQYNLSCSTNGDHRHDMRFDRLGSGRGTGIPWNQADNCVGFDNGPCQFAGGHSHTISSNGGDKAHNNMPPYLAVYIWKRVA